MTTPEQAAVPEGSATLSAKVAGLLDGLDSLDVAEHPAVYENVDQLLREQLSNRQSSEQ